MKKKLMFIAVAFLFSGCFDYDKDKVLKDKGKNYQITVPGLWLVEDNRNNEADIQAESIIFEKYLTVFAEPKEDYVDNMDLDGVAELFKENMNTQLTDINSEDYEELILNGMNAKSIILSGSADGKITRYFITFVESDKHFIQLIFYSTKHMFDVNLEEFKKVRGTFKKAAPSETKSAK